MEIEIHEAQVRVTYDGQQGDLPDPVPFDATDAQVRTWAAEALRTGLAGIDAQPDLAAGALDDFVVDRYPAKDDLPNRLMLRPKVPFGG